MSPRRRMIGMVLLAVGFFALITPFTPGSWLIFVGAEILGIEFLCADNVRLAAERHAGWFMPIACIAAPFLAGGIGSIFTAQGLGWYALLIRPAWTPPNWAFAPVWSALYLLMGLAALLVWRTGRGGRRAALNLFFLQLAANALWSFVFFGLRAPLPALVIIVLLWAAILRLVFLFAPLSRRAAWLLAPYLLWVSYAATLNLGIVFLN